MKKTKALLGRLFTWFRDEYNEHEMTWDPDYSRDFLDAYIGERKRADEEQNEKSSFYGDLGDMNYVTTMYHLFLAGSETTSTTLTFAVLYMLNDPVPFQKAQKEIDEVVGRSRLPTWDDKPNLPYFEALLAELMRRANVAPFAVIHSNDEEGYISGFK